MAEQKPIVIAQDIVKSFRIPLEGSSGIKQKVINVFKGRKGYRDFNPLNGVSFTVNEGDFFGIVGKNGSGKSTLLKTLAGIYTPTSGGVDIRGTLVPFIELGVGFNPELNGRENVYLNGALLGFNRKEVDAMYEEIVDFAELHDFMEENLKNYSSGMQVRLAFSIAIQAKGDVLLLDEVLAVGDSAFQKKCFDYFEKLKKEKKTIILVTHDMGAIKRFCNKAILIEDGRVKSSGSPDEVANQYTLDNLVKGSLQSHAENMSLAGEIKSLNAKALSPLNIASTEKFEFEISYELREDIEIDLGISILYQGQSIIEKNTVGLEMGHKKNKKYTIKYSVDLAPFNAKQLQVDVAIFKRDGFTLLGFKTDAIYFEITQDDLPPGGLLKSQGEWTQ